jgi:hypothetical protein
MSAKTICLFGFCSPECRADRDCARGALPPDRSGSGLRAHERADCGAQPCPRARNARTTNVARRAIVTGLPCLEVKPASRACRRNLHDRGWRYVLHGHHLRRGTRCPSVQIDGDCKTLMCDGSGAIRVEPAPNDLPIDGNECTIDMCTGGVASNPDEDDGKPCLGGTASTELHRTVQQRSETQREPTSTAGRRVPEV